MELTPETASPMLAPNSGNFQFQATFDANITLAQRAVIQQAINEWNAIIQSRGVNPGSYPISFANGPLSEEKFALCTNHSFPSSGNLSRAEITINTTSGSAFYIDLTPADDVEFATEAPPGVDLLTVMRHEIGHAIGWAPTKRTRDLIAGNVFDAGRTNIGILMTTLEDLHCDHTLHPNELMVPTVEGGTRKAIQLYPTAALVARAFHYQIPMQFVDPAATGAQTGSASEPWQSFAAAMSLAPLDVPLLLAPQVFKAGVNATFSTRRSIFSARGGATIRVP